MGSFSVSQFIEFLNTALTTAVFPEGVAVEGEVSDFRVSQGKWIWFNLKDEGSIISCFSTVWQLRTPLEGGMQVRIHGIPKVHAKSGKFSVTVDRVELVGEGALRRAFELLKKKLEHEGLFDAARKRPLPRFPTRIALITSRDAAACSDFLRILGDRWGGIDVDLFHCQVQGRDAVGDIVRAFGLVNRDAGMYDLAVLTRGGGSLEDLHAFNDEDVARAIYSCKVPVIVGVGHERDESLADFVADVRASTPSSAAERVAPSREEYLSRIAASERRITSKIEGAIMTRRLSVDRLSQRLSLRVTSAVADLRHTLRDFKERMLSFSADVAARRVRTGNLAVRLAASAGFWTDRFRADVAAKERMLVSHDPRALLAKGYAIVRGPKGVLRDAHTVARGDSVGVRLHRGSFSAEVLRIEE
jgi:exodeoxyribonuclease VII large subunit